MLKIRDGIIDNHRIEIFGQESNSGRSLPFLCTKLSHVEWYINNCPAKLSIHVSKNDQRVLTVGFTDKDTALDSIYNGLLNSYFDHS